MGCASTSKKVIKWAAKEIGPLLLASAGRSVATIEELAKEDPAWWTSGTKRKVVEAFVRTEARRLERDVPGHLINLAIEHAVTLLNSPFTEGPEVLGDTSDADIDAA